MNNQIEVYVKTDEQSRILEIGSSIFLTDTSGWIKIDAGEGDRYYHAQNHYLSDSVTTIDGIPRYKLVEGKPVERASDEIEHDRAKLPPPAQSLSDLQKENDLLKQQVHALTEKADFHEDLFAEVAEKIYA